MDTIIDLDVGMTTHVVDSRIIRDFVVDNALIMDVRRDIRAPQPQVAIRGAYHFKLAEKTIQVKTATGHCRTDNLAACREHHHRGDIFRYHRQLLERLFLVTTAPVFNALIEFTEHLAHRHAG